MMEWNGRGNNIKKDEEMFCLSLKFHSENTKRRNRTGYKVFLYTLFS